MMLAVCNDQVGCARVLVARLRYVAVDVLLLVSFPVGYYASSLTTCVASILFAGKKQALMPLLRSSCLALLVMNMLDGELAATYLRHSSSRLHMAHVPFLFV